MDIEILVRVGEYKTGTDPDVDLGVAKNKAITAFLQQATDEFDSFATMLEKS